MNQRHLPTPAMRGKLPPLMARLVAAGLVGVLLLLAAAVAWAAPPPEPSPVAVTDGWAFRWGDSPLDGDGRPTWTREARDASGWTAIERPQQPPGRAGSSTVWFRAPLPAWSGQSPSLFFHSIDLTFELFLDDDPLYRFGERDASGGGRFSGWPWHIVRLPPDFAGRTLSIRVFSDVSEIGVVQDVVLASPEQHLLDMLRRDIDWIVLALLFVVVALLNLLLWTRGEQWAAFTALGVCALLMGVWTFSQTEVKQLVAYAPMAWCYADLGALFFLPVSLLGFVAGTFGARHRRLMLAVGACFVIFAVGALTLPWVGLFSLPQTIRIFNVLEVLGFSLVLAIAAREARRGDPEARIFFVGFALLAPFALYDVANTWLGWSRAMGPWGMLLFVGSLALIMRRRFMQVLKAATVDGLTQTANRGRFDVLLELEWRRAVRSGETLSVIMVDIDYFKPYNDTYGHGPGDACLKAVADVLRASCHRAGDLVARYGGEEFAVLLPATEKQGAVHVAEIMRAGVEGLAIEHRSSDIADGVTISAGVACELPTGDSDPKLLVASADVELYRAKDRGRNQVCSVPNTPPEQPG